MLKLIENFKKSFINWVTTVLGSIAGGSLLIAAGIDGDLSTPIIWSQVIAGIAVMLLGVFGKDAITGSSPTDETVKETIKDVLKDEVVDLSVKIKDRLSKK